MSYEQYKLLLVRMTKDELEQEIVKLQQAVNNARTSKGKRAWSTMLTSALQQLQRNASR